MDQPNQPIGGGEKPGAPELDSSAKAPDETPQPEKNAEAAEISNSDQSQPAFRPNPTYRGVEPSQVKTNFTASDHKKRTEYLKSVRETRTKKSHFWRNLSLVLVVLIAAAAFYWLFLMPDSSPKEGSNKPTTPGSQQTQQPDSEPQTSDQIETKSYAASSLPVELEYPADWTADEENGILTITSPVVELTAASGNKTPSKMQLTVLRPQDADLKAFDEGSVVAVLASEKIRYTTPAPQQQGTTYVSFLQYPNTTTKGGLDAIYITGNSGYVYAGKAYKEDLRNVEPLIGLNFIACGNADCPSSTQEPLAISSDMWAQESFKKPLLDMLKSIRISG